MKNGSRKKEPHDQQKRGKRPEGQEDRRRSPGSEQRDRDEDVPRPPMTGGDDDER
jgi:hypothetical protein